MKYVVTKQDIDGGLPAEPCYCPVARAIKRRHVSRQIHVGYRYVDIGDTEYRLPVRVSDWIRDYDQGRPVQSIRFELLATTR